MDVKLKWLTFTSIVNTGLAVDSFSFTLKPGSLGMMQLINASEDGSIDCDSATVKEPDPDPVAAES